MTFDLAQSLSWDHERVHLVRSPDVGLVGIIAIHSTALGPGLGGLRIRRYPAGAPEALDDALRLSRAMSLKASACGLDLGGAKAAVIDDGRDDLRRHRLTLLAGEINALEGRYITAEDIGTTTADMDFLASHTPHVVGRSRRDGSGGDPSPYTARTVLGSIRAALRLVEGSDEVAYRRVGVLGLGKVGAAVALELAAAGALVTGYDPSNEAVTRLANTPRLDFARSADELLGQELDVLAPCAIGGVIDEAWAEELQCRVICGAANNPLNGRQAAEILASRKVLYVPDFLANCGGLIQGDAERRGDDSRVDRDIEEAVRRTGEILGEAARMGRLPVDMAEELACARIEQARRAEVAPRATSYEAVEAGLHCPRS